MNLSLFNIMNFELINNDCLEALKDISDNSIDLLFCDLPYGETSCKWDTTIDLNLFWEQINRVCKITTPMFFTCSTRFGVSLINSNPKNFRYDLVWVKSQAAGFLNAKKMPMRKHEMVYVFYRKLPLYDLSSHKHKFIGDNIKEHNGKILPLPQLRGCKDKVVRMKPEKYDTPLPSSVIKDDVVETIYGGGCNREKNADVEYKKLGRKNGESAYDPPLPSSVIKDDVYNAIERFDNGKLKACRWQGRIEGEPLYEPPLPSSVLNTQIYRDGLKQQGPPTGNLGYEPPLPNSILEIKSEKGKHPTQKPTDLIKWCLKYYSKEGDTILDPTMGSGSTGVACKDMNRNFIGIEKDEKIFKVAEERINL